MAAKYRAEAEQHLKLLFYEPWMTESDWLEFVDRLFKEAGISYEDMSNKIQQGIDMGFSIEIQTMLVECFAEVLRRSKNLLKERIAHDQKTL